MRTQAVDLDPKERLSRLEQVRRDLKNEFYEPDMPPIELGGSYLLRYFLEVGPAISIPGMGMSALDHREIRAWQDNIGLQLRPWECRALRNLSKEYVAELRRSEKYGTPSPYTDGDLWSEEFKFNVLPNRLRAILRS